MNHLIRKENNELIIVNEKISLDEILNNDKMAPCYGDITQYILDNDKKLRGIITTYDIKRCQGNRNKCINNTPIVLIDNPLVEELAIKIFEKRRIRQIPIVDYQHHLLYALERPNTLENQFYNYAYRKEDLNYIERTIINTREKFSDKKVYLITPEDLPQLSEYIITLDQIDEAEHEQYVLVFTFRYEYEALETLRKLRTKHIKFIICPLLKQQFQYSVMKYMNTDKLGTEVLQEEAKKNGIYYDAEDFSDMFQAIQLTKEIEGCLLEIGVFRGDSARAMLSYMKKNDIKRKGYFLDLFEGFTYTSAFESEDLSLPLITPHNDTSLEIARERLQEFENITIIKTDIICESLPEEIQSIAICNIDLGMYETEHAALNKVKDKISRGGIIIAHNYGRTPGCISAYLAIKEFYEENQELFYGIYMSSGQFIMIRK